MDFTFQVLNNIRAIFKDILEKQSLETLNKIPEGFNNNIIWNIGHAVVSEQLLAYGLSGLDLGVSPELVAAYRKDSKPETNVTEEEVETIKTLLHSTIKKTEADYNAGIFKTYTEYTVSTTGNTLRNIDEALQFITVHEGLHYGYVLALIKALNA